MLLRAASTGLSGLRCVLRQHVQETRPPANFGARSMAADVTFQVEPLAVHLAEVGPARTATCDPDQALMLYRNMRTIRQLELAATALFQEHKASYQMHLYSGQEATCVGIRAAMNAGDSAITSYRCHGWALVMGMSPREILGAVTGRATCRNRGKGGPMHMYDPGRNFYGGSGIIGSQCPVGAGIALAHKYNNSGSVCFTAYGEGAANQGQLAEAINMSALWKLPVVFVCENNHYSIHTSEERVSANRNFYRQGDAVPGVKVDGMDVLAVREAALWATAQCRTGHGPVIIESQTYRFTGHSMLDPGSGYRSEQEIQRAMQHDPIDVFGKRVVDAGLVTEEQLQAVDEEIAREIGEATQAARDDPAVSAEILAHDIVADDLGRKEVRSVSPFVPMRHETLGESIHRN